MNMPKLPHVHAPHWHRPNGAPPRLPGWLSGGSGASGFFADLFRDLRDRRLLPVAGALIAAILAAPIVLASGGSSTVPVKSPVTAASLPSPIAAAVTLAEHGIRITDKRGLGSAKDPFVQFAAPKAAAGASKLLGLGTGVATGPKTVIGSGIAKTFGLTGTGGTPTGSTGSPTGSISGLPSGSGSGSPAGSPQTVLATYLVNVRFGEAGSTLQSRHDVGYLGFLPGDSKPVFVYVGASQNGSKAFFLLTGAVSLSGNGACMVKLPVGGCQLIAMKAGDSESVVYVGDGKTYRLKLDAIKSARLP